MTEQQQGVMEEIARCKERGFVSPLLDPTSAHYNPRKAVAVRLVGKKVVNGRMPSQRDVNVVGLSATEILAAVLEGLEERLAELKSNCVSRCTCAGDMEGGDITTATTQFYASHLNLRTQEISAPNFDGLEVLPLFPRMFVEFTSPEGITRPSEREIVPKRVGIIVETDKTETGDWKMKTAIISEDIRGKIFLLDLNYLDTISSAGELAPEFAFNENLQWSSDLSRLPKADLPPQDGRSHSDRIVACWLSNIAPMLFAFALLHCRNVTIEKVNPTIHSNKHRRKMKGKPAITHHTIVIKDRKGRTVNTAAVETGIRQGLHMRAGSFRTYTAERPLFGKVAGRFWFPAYIAGSDKEGVITSEYRVA